MPPDATTVHSSATAGNEIWYIAAVNQITIVKLHKIKWRFYGLAYKKEPYLTAVYSAINFELWTCSWFQVSNCRVLTRTVIGLRKGNGSTYIKISHEIIMYKFISD